MRAFYHFCIIFKFNPFLLDSLSWGHNTTPSLLLLYVLYTSLIILSTIFLQVSFHLHYILFFTFSFFSPLLQCLPLIYSSSSFLPYNSVHIQVHTLLLTASFIFFFLIQFHSIFHPGFVDEGLSTSCLLFLVFSYFSIHCFDEDTQLISTFNPFSLWVISTNNNVMDSECHTSTPPPVSR